MRWDEYFTSSGIAVPDHLIVAENTAVQNIAALYAQTPLDTLRAWQTFRPAFSNRPSSTRAPTRP
jgi:putative endopeptidase